MLEDKIQNAITPILNIYSKIELELIEKIAKHFNLNDEFINSDYWYFEKLKELGGLNNETLKLLEKYIGKTKQELLKAMKDIGVNSIPVDQLNIATQKNALLDPNKIINSVNIQNLIKYSYNDVEKSFLSLNKTIQEQVRQAYTDIITETYIKINSGVCSYQEAILESLDKLGDKGISVLAYQDKNGNIRNYDVVGTVRRDLLVATRGLAGKVNEEVIKESGNHIVRVTNHFGARIGDGEQDYTNHAWWQEMQFFCWNYDGKATEEEKKLPDFMEHCNYGDVQGIVGINCKHLFMTWYGSTKKEELEFTYDENKEQYEKTQKQRYLENGVRKWKRKQVIAKNSLDEEYYKKASSKAREWQDRLNTFTNENDLKRDYTREHIKNYKNIKIETNDENILNNIKAIKNKIVLKDITNQKNNLINNAFINQTFKNIALKTNVKSIKQGGNKSYHNAGNIVLSNKYKNRTIVHEMAHNIDYSNKWLSSNKNFIQAIKIDKDFIMKNKSIYVNLIKNNSQYRELSDIIGGITNNEIVGIYRHTKKYWKQPNKLEREIFAQFFTVSSNDDINQLLIFQQYLPSIFREFDNIIRRL
nr:MAG TPA: minor capsid protein [Caudoviricetes sp.]